MTLRERLPAVLALAIPVLAGAAWMAMSGAPSHYPLTNLGALGLAIAWILLGRGPHTAPSRHILAGALLAVMVAAVWIGPELASITAHPVRRWFPFGPLALHTGMLTTPPLAILAARNRALAAPLLLAGVGAALLQPDAATGFALTFAAVGLHHVNRDWQVGVAAIVAFFASLWMAVRGELAPREWVENVLTQAATVSVLMAVLLAVSLAAAFALILFAVPFDRAKRFTLAGLFFGFCVCALMAPYPTPLIGYGAAPILGFGLALGLHRIPLR
ncbi:hypothetical protein GRI62_03905 [Erythrobacter arachoides]|uniref:Uncharacterized protein n=1 Tax=Aurantiacibacter arachoides TaxID=1850444 RepID=A0A844ZZW3_9SPHN|nr:hypothetical protein [Aurantiacibacter arachoides]MXO92752.1 hypothetical protein [Aurantiacibacter arachoides]GGD54753.1 hypothetical protein GCM10011411_13380 [Aurantiacibacter arachoides]